MRIQTIFFLSLMLLLQSAHASELFGTVDAVAGSATLSNENANVTAIVQGEKFYVGQSMLTGNDGEVHIVTVDSGLIALRPIVQNRLRELSSSTANERNPAIHLDKARRTLREMRLYQRQ